MGFVTEEDYPDRMQRKIADRQLIDMIAQECFAHFTFILRQENFQKYVGVDQIHQRQSNDLCCNSTAVYSFFN